MEPNIINSDCCNTPLVFIDFVKPYDNMKANYQCIKCGKEYKR